MNTEPQLIDSTALSFDEAEALIGFSKHDWRPRQAIQYNYELSADKAEELLGAAVLYRHECMALLTGIQPDRNGGSSYLCPEGQGLPAAERLLSDAKSGVLRFPLKTAEFRAWAGDWRDHLPEATLVALEKGFAVINPVAPPRVRKNSRSVMLEKTREGMEEVLRLFSSQNFKFDRSALHGTKDPYIDFLLKRPEFEGKKRGAVKDYLKDLTEFQWAGGRPNEAEVTHIYGLLGLRRDDKHG